MNTWSGSFSNEKFLSPGTYQAKNGIRVFVDMATNPGPVTILSVIAPENNSSFIIEWDNPNRELITLTTPDEYESVFSIFRNLIPSVSTRLCRGLVGFTFIEGVDSIEDHWEVFTFFQFGIRIHDVAFVGWKGRNTNGLATLLSGGFSIIEIERTALGFYTARFNPGTIIQGETMIIPGSVAIGLPTDNAPEMLILDVGMAVANEILINTGRRNKAGVFFDDDLIQDVNNFHAITLQQFP